MIEYGVHRRKEIKNPMLVFGNLKIKSYILSVNYQTGLVTAPCAAEPTNEAYFAKAPDS